MSEGAHIRGATDAWLQVLAELHPEHAWIAESRKGKRSDRQRIATATVRREDTRAGQDGAHPIASRQPSWPDDNALEQAA